MSKSLKVSMLITLLILTYNTFHYGQWLHDRFTGFPELSRSLLSSLYKIFIYWGSTILVAYLCNQNISFNSARERCSRWRHPRIYVLIAIWWVGLWYFTREIEIWVAHHWIFYVLVINSLVEEWVFRGYIQTILTQTLGAVQWICIQAFLFASVHAPFYYVMYQQWRYEAINIQLWAILPFEIWGRIVLPMLMIPLVLWLMRGVVTQQTKSLRPAIVWHSVHNWVALMIL
jgi:membrane protease YdiL (CAAX protease family)